MVQRRRTRLKDNFDSSSWSLSDGQESTNWHCNYISSGTADVRNATSPRIGKVCYLKPGFVDNETRATFVRTKVQYNDFEMVVDIRTVSQNRPVSPNNWEVAWIMWHYTDDWHHYYTLIQADGGLEMGRKDYATQIEGQQFLVTNGNTAPSFVMGQWYNIRIRSVGSTIKIWVDGVLRCNVTDDGTFGLDSATDGLPPPPTAAMLGGYVGFYCEDAEVEYDNFAIRAL